MGRPDCSPCEAETAEEAIEKAKAVAPNLEAGDRYVEIMADFEAAEEEDAG